MAPTEAPQPAAVRHAAAYFASRLANALFALGQAALTSRILGSSEAGTFFLFWTATWLLATVLKFGLDGILPRLVAEAGGDAARLSSARTVLRAGAVATVLACPLALWGFNLLSHPLAAPLALAIAVCWAAVQVLGGLARAYGRADAAGLISNVIWSAAAMVAPLVLLAGGRSWERLALVTLAVSVGAVVASAVLARRVVGAAAVRRLVARDASALRVDRDVTGAAILTTLYEVIVWLPVVLAAVVRVSPSHAAAVYTGARLAGLISWGYQAVVAVVTPRLAAAVAALQMDRIRALLLGSSLAGLAATLPLALLAVVASHPLLRAFDPSYAVFATGFALLAAARVADGLTGAVGEALLIGRRTWLDVALVTIGVGLGVVVTSVMAPRSELLAVAAGAAAGWTATNVLRVIAVRRLLLAGWQGRVMRPRIPTIRPSGASLRTRVTQAAIAVLAAIPAIVVVALRPSSTAAPFAGVACAAVATAVIVALLVRNRRALGTLASPLAIVALVVAAEYALRAASLALDPKSATEGVLLLGYDPAAVAWASAFGSAALLLFTGGFLAATTGAATRQPSCPAAAAPIRADRSELPKRWRLRVFAALGVGTLLWLTLFMRIGGPSALINDPASLHLNQFGGLYGVIGLLICMGAIVVVLEMRSSFRGLGTKLVVAAAVVLAVAGSTALASRGPLMATAVAVVALLARGRRPRKRTVVIAGVICAVGLLGSLTLRSVRDYAQEEPLRDALISTVHTPVLTFATADLNEFDHFVGLTRLVPKPLPRLRGQSFGAVLTVFVPRALWPSKPLPIDFRLGRALYGPSAAAGTPMTLAGEAFWNFGSAGGLAAMLGLGFIFGAIWSLLARLPAPARNVLQALVVGYTYLLLTRPLAAMTQTTVAACLAAVIVMFAAGRLRLPWRLGAWRGIASEAWTVFGPWRAAASAEAWHATRAASKVGPRVAAASTRTGAHAARATGLTIMRLASRAAAPSAPLEADASDQSVRPVSSGLWRDLLRAVRGGFNPPSSPIETR